MSVSVEGTTISVSFGLFAGLMLFLIVLEASSMLIKRVSLIHSCLLYIMLWRQARKQAPTGWKYEAGIYDFVSIDGRDRRFSAYVTMRSKQAMLHRHPVMTFSAQIDWKGKADLSAMISECQRENMHANDKQALAQLGREDRLKELGI